MKKLRSRLTYANVVSTVALFLALGGGVAFAAGKIQSGDIANGAVKTSKLHQRAVSSGKLALGAVRSNQIANGAVSSAQLADGAVGPNKIAAGSIASTQIAARGVAPSNLEVPLFFVASPTGGSATLPAEGEVAPYPLTGADWTQGPGQVNVIFGAGIATLAYDGGGGGSCQVVILVGTNGTPVNGENGGQFQTSSTTPQTVEANLGGLPVIDPPSTKSRQLSASIQTNGECTAGSTVDSARFRVVDFG